LQFSGVCDKMLAKITIKTNINSHEIKHLNIFKKGFFPQLMKFSTGLCTLSNKNPQQVASDNYYLTSRINLAYLSLNNDEITDNNNHQIT